MKLRLALESSFVFICWMFQPTLFAKMLKTPALINRFVLFTIRNCIARKFWSKLLVILQGNFYIMLSDGNQPTP